MGKLIYKPDSKSDKGRIDFPIRFLADPLGGEFDLTQCGDTGKYLSIATGYRQRKKTENANKFEVWIAPRFLIEKNITSSAAHFQAIMENWSASVAPVGLFWTNGKWDELDWVDHLTTDSLEGLVCDNNLYEKWRIAHSTRHSPQRPTRPHEKAGHFHVSF